MERRGSWENLKDRGGLRGRLPYQWREKRGAGACKCVCKVLWAREDCAVDPCAVVARAVAKHDGPDCSPQL
eukprot:186572-Rhodomonas_salina.4